MVRIFDDFGIRFEYPNDWELDVDDDGTRQVISLQSPEGPAFLMVTLDGECPPPAEVADEALAAMQAEYPELDARPVLEVIDGQRAVGHDLDFFSLDMTNGCSIRCFRTPRRTVLVFAQWSQVDDDETAEQMRALARASEETDA